MSASFAPAAFMLAALAALADWRALARQSQHFVYIFKPATLALLLVAGYLLTLGPHDGWAAPYFLFALTASLVGDVCLMLQGDRFFLYGLIAFLVAHLGYIAGLNPTLPPLISMPLLLPIALLLAWLLRAVTRGLQTSGKTKLLIPVFVYGLTIGLMLFSAWATLFRADWSTARRLTVIFGASLFFASDALLAWNRFVAPSTSLTLPVIVAYHLGQFALTASLAIDA